MEKTTRRKRSKGVCQYCGKEYTKTGMLKHLSTCKERQSAWLPQGNGDKATGYFTLSIEGKYRKDYWLIVEIREDAELRDLDQFLRDIWLECCGHLSAFRIDGGFYEVDPDPDYGKGLSMDVRVKDILRVGMTFEHEYDYGSTTVLKINVISYRKGWDEIEVEIMARNKPIEFICDVCGERAATEICSICICEGEGLMCDTCSKGHECGEEVLLPVVNSPRCGVCGYTGSVMYPND